MSPTPHLTGLPPIIGNDPRVLILGSFPSAISLEKKEYYANPRNRFWHLMEALLGTKAQLPYHVRTVQLKEKGIALWDVTKECEREGSDDAAIKNEIVNDISGFLLDHPSISVVILNGGGAARIFHRHFSDGGPGPAGNPRSEGAGVVPGGWGHSGLSRDRPGGKGPLWTWIPGVMILTLPSTSPANARFGLPQLEDAWSVLKETSGK
jgi:TDG/mug DNA glycosylase family protein